MKKLFPVFVLFLFLNPLAAQVTMLKDIDRSGIDEGSYPENFVNFKDSLLFFTADDNLTGRELWASDAAEGNAWQLADIYNGIRSSDPSNFILTDSILYFTATDQSGFSLWKTKGSDAIKVISIDVEPQSKTFANFRLVADTIFFIRSDAGNVSGLYTIALARPVISFVKEVPAVSASITVNGKYYFVAGKSLFVSDGSESGTTILKTVGNAIDGFRIYRDSLLFIADYRSLWKTDGTIAGTTLLLDFAPADWSYPFVLKNEFFVMTGAYYPSLGWTLLKRREDIQGFDTIYHDGADSVWGDGRRSGTGDNFIYFPADDGVHGVELWRSDGTGEGTMMVEDSYAGINSTYPQSFILKGDSLYFRHGSLLYLYPGKGSSVYSMEILDYFNSQGIIFKGNYMFSETDDSTGVELRKHSGTYETKTTIKNINTATSASFSRITVAGDNLFFMADDRINGEQLWKTDGSPSGTSVVREKEDFSYMVDQVHSLNSFNNRLCFVATVNDYGPEPWITDGTAQNTYLLKDIIPGSATVFPDLFTTVDSFLYFVSYPWDLWESRGTAETTRQITSSTTSPSCMMAFRSKLYFSDLIYTLRRYDRADDTVTIIFRDYDIDLENFVAADSLLYFTAYKDGYGLELWVTNGDQGNIKPVKDINPGAYDGNISNWLTVGNKLYFSADDGFNGQEIWVSDGTEDGTVMISDIIPGAGGSHPHSLIHDSTYVYFIADMGVDQTDRIWRTDGTMAGTEMLTGHYEQPSEIAVMNDTLYFSAYNEDCGGELFYCTDFKNGALPYCDINPGPVSSHPSNLTVMNNQLFFLASTNDYGRELFVNRIDPSAVFQACNIRVIRNSGSAVEIRWTNGGGLFRAVFVSEDTTGLPYISYGTTYAANTAFGLGTGTGNPVWYCVANGVDSTAVITGLESYKKYRIFVSEYTGLPGEEKYVTSECSNNPLIMETGEITSVSPPVSGNDIILYPNPVRDRLICRNIKPGQQISVYDYDGRKLHVETVNGDHADIDFSRFEKGIYIIKVLLDTKSETFKVVKQ